MVIAAHARVGLVGGAAGQDHRVRRGHMGVGADHDTGAAVAEMAGGHLLRGRLGMDVDEGGLHRAAAGVFPERRIERRERVVEGAFHEDLAEGLRHQHLPPLRRPEDARACARRVLGEVERAQECAALARMNCSISRWSKA